MSIYGKFGSSSFKTVSSIGENLIRGDVEYVRKSADPTIADINYKIPTVWINNTDNGIWILSDINGTSAVWTEVNSGSADVVGPASSTDNAVVRFNGTTGKLIQNSGAILDDSNNLTGVASLTISTATNQLILSGPTRTATINTVQPATNSRVYTVPDAGGNDSFAFLDAVQSLTNKTMTAITNSIRATELGTSGASVSISSASAPGGSNYVLRTTSATTATWQNINPTFAIIWDEKTTGTSGGSSVASTWTKRNLNNITTTAGSDISIASSQITLVAGNYILSATSVGHRINNHMIRIRNVTDGTTIQQGNTARSQSGDSTSTEASVIGYISVAGTKVFEIQHNCVTTRAVDGFGNPAGIAGVVEIYSTVFITKYN